MSENNNLKLRSIKCPTCGGQIDFEVGRNKTVCPYCGGDVVIDEPGWLGELDRYDLKLQNAREALNNKEWGRAYSLYEECIRIKDSDAECWQGKIEARTKGLSASFDERTEGNFRCFLNRSDKGESDPFAARYKEYLLKVADYDASNAVSNAKDNIEYFKRMIESSNARIDETQGKIRQIGNQPTAEVAEKRYGSSKVRLILNTVLLFLAPVLVLGFAVLASYLVIKAFTGDVHLIGIIASIIAALVFAGVTKLVWKNYRRVIDSFKRRRNDKLAEDKHNDELEKHKKELISNRENDINVASDMIEYLSEAIKDIEAYIGIDRDKRVQSFYKQHLDDAGLTNDITVDPLITQFGEREKNYKKQVGYKYVTIREY